MSEFPDRFIGGLKLPDVFYASINLMSFCLPESSEWVLSHIESRDIITAVDDISKIAIPICLIDENTPIEVVDRVTVVVICSQTHRISYLLHISILFYLARFCSPDISENMFDSLSENDLGIELMHVTFGVIGASPGMAPFNPASDIL